jgi:outer membrane immunogenic protein
MLKLLSGVAFGALLAAPAVAADLPARVPVSAPAIVSADYNWSGVYFGLHGGYGGGETNWTFPGTTTSTSHDVDGYVGGFHVGVQRQFGRFVLGLEGAASLTGMEGNSTCPTATLRCESDIDHFWRVGARAGIAVGATGNWLIYGTGGFARAKLDTQQVVIATGTETGTDSVHHHGFYGGGGIEVAVAPNWILGVEAFWVSLDSERHFTPAGTVVTGATRDIDLDFAVIQARATYKFGW